MTPFDDHRDLTRRSLLQRGSVAFGALAAPGLLTACGDDDGSSSKAGRSDGKYDIDSDVVVYADYGGTTRTARQEAYFKPFTELTSVRVVPADADPAKMILFAERERSEWDVINTDGFDVIRFANDGLIRPLPDWVTKCDLVPEKYQKWGTGGYSASVVICYSTEEEGPAPESLADFWDTSKFPGKRSLPNFAFLQLEAALLADGVPHDEVFPIDFERAFAKLDELRDDLLFYDSFGQGMQYLAQGSVSMVLNSNSRGQIFKDQGLPIDFTWNDAILLSWTGEPVPKHAPHADAAFALVDFMAQPEQQAQFARLNLYGPTNSAALDLLDEATLEKMPNAPEHEKIAYVVDDEALAKQIEEYTDRFNEWLAKS